MTDIINWWLEPGNGSVKVDYKDSNTNIIDFSLYRVSLYLDCEISETT